MTSHGIMIFLALYLESRGLERWEVGLVAGSFSVAAVVTRFSLGGWLDRYGRRPFFLWGALLLGLGCLPYPHLPVSTVLMTLMRSLQGIGFALYLTSLWTWVADLAPAGRVAELQGIFGISGLVAGALGPAVAEWVIASSSFTDMFRLAGLLGVCGALLMAPLPDYRPITDHLGTRPSFFRVARSRSLATMTLATLALGWSIGLVFTFLAPFGRVVGLNSVAPYFVAFSVASVLVRLGAGRAADRLGPERLIPVFLALGGLAPLLLSFLEQRPNVTMLVLAGALNGLGHGVVFPALSLLTMLRTRPEERGTGMAVFTAIFDGGLFVGAVVSGFLAHRTSYADAFLLGGLLAMVAALLFFLGEFWRSPGQTKGRFDG